MLITGNPYFFFGQSLRVKVEKQLPPSNINWGKEAERKGYQPRKNCQFCQATNLLGLAEKVLPDLTAKERMGVVNSNSNGVPLLLALYSAYYQKPVPNDIAATGAVDKEGNIGAIGGLHEKIIATVEAGNKTLILPADQN
ncbi:7385_t:CDS:2 [Entrophospora sp. SA101]|nr:7385_t:CDS:2 [Entrophospora sp. SA101]